MVRDLTSAIRDPSPCTGICLTKLRARMPADQTKASPPHTSSVRGLVRTKRGSRLNVCYVWLLPVHRYLLDEAAGTDARGPDEIACPPHTRSVRGLLRTKCGSRPNVCYVWLLPVHGHLFDEAAGTDSRGPDEIQPASLAIGLWTFEDQACVQT